MGWPRSNTITPTDRSSTVKSSAKARTIASESPGATAGSAPFITIVVFMRGLLTHVYTRLYFADEEAANAADPVLATAPAERRRTLIALREKTAGGVQYRFDI